MRNAASAYGDLYVSGGLSTPHRATRCSSGDSSTTVQWRQELCHRNRTAVVSSVGQANNAVHAGKLQTATGPSRRVRPTAGKFESERAPPPALPRIRKAAGARGIAAGSASVLLMWPCWPCLPSRGRLTGLDMPVRILPGASTTAFRPVDGNLRCCKICA